LARRIALPKGVRYYMHISDETGFLEDEEGRDLPDEESARAEAVAAARELMASDLRDGYLDLTSFIEVEDEGHKLLFTIAFGDVVKVTRRP
jgi:hypothetical protein